jgi:hypothetical protein
MNGTYEYMKRGNIHSKQYINSRNLQQFVLCENEKSYTANSLQHREHHCRLPPIYASVQQRNPKKKIPEPV